MWCSKTNGLIPFCILSHSKNKNSRMTISGLMHLGWRPRVFYDMQKVEIEIPAWFLLQNEPNLNNLSN